MSRRKGSFTGAQRYFPAEHGKHLRNTNLIESAFATQPTSKVTSRAATPTA